MIEPEVIGGMTSVAIVIAGLIAGPQRTVKAFEWLGWALAATWFKYTGQSIPDKSNQGVVETMPPHDKLIPDKQNLPIDYKKLEADNLKSMKDSWDERFLKLHKLEDLTNSQLKKMAKYPDVDPEAIRDEQNKRLVAQNANWMEFEEDAVLSNKCARDKHAKCKDPMCDCDCHVEAEHDLI